MKLKDFIEKNPPKKQGPKCTICSTLPKHMLADVNAALACGDQAIVVWRWLRFDQKRTTISECTVRRHRRVCLLGRKRKRHGTA